MTSLCKQAMLALALVATLATATQAAPPTEQERLQLMQKKAQFEQEIDDHESNIALWERQAETYAQLSAEAFRNNNFSMGGYYSGLSQGLRQNCREYRLKVFSLKQQIRDIERRLVE